MTLLTNCAGATSSSACPALVEYTPEFQDRATVELSFIDHDAAIRTMLNDYSGLRDQVRACRG